MGSIQPGLADSQTAAHRHALARSRRTPTDARIKIVETGSQSGSQIAQRPRPTMDAHGAQAAVLRVKADPPDQTGRLVETYGSEGWGFESLRVRQYFP